MSSVMDFKLPSLRDAEQWKAECEQIDEQVAALVKRKRGIEALIAAARQLWTDFGVPSPLAERSPAAAEQDVFEFGRGSRSRVPVRDSLPWSSLRTGWRTPPEPVPRAMQEDPMRSALARRRPDKPPRWPGHRHGSEAFEQRPSIINYRGPLTTPDDYAPPAARREAQRVHAVPDFTPPPPPMPEPAPVSVEAAIIDFLNRVTVGAPSAVILAELRKTAALAELISQNKTYIYDALSRLVDEGELVKGGGLYYRNRQKDIWAEAAE